MSDKKVKEQVVEDPKKEEEEEDELDLFGSDAEADEEAKKLAEAKKKEVAEVLRKVEEKAAKKRAAAKSIVVFDVKVYEQDEDFDKLASEIKEQITQEGLIWSEGHKLLPVGFGMNKLQLTMVISDELVSSDDILERIEEKFEDNVQSTDIESFNKL